MNMNTGPGLKSDMQHSNDRSSMHLQVSRGRPGRQIWMISFADLMAILLTFMVVAFSTREMRPASWQNVSQSLQGVFQDDRSLTSALSNEEETASREGLSDVAMAKFVEDLFPDLAGMNGVQLTSRGVEVNLGAVAAHENGLTDFAKFLSSVDRSLLIWANVPRPSENTTAILRVLAWEKGLADAFALRSELVAGGLSIEPRISVSAADGRSESVMLVIKKHGRSSS